MIKKGYVWSSDGQIHYREFGSVAKYHTLLSGTKSPLMYKFTWHVIAEDNPSY